MLPATRHKITCATKLPAPAGEANVTAKETYVSSSCHANSEQGHAFEQRFQNSELTQWRKANDLWQHVQGVNENVESYITSGVWRSTVSLPAGFGADPQKF